MGLRIYLSGIGDKYFGPDAALATLKEITLESSHNNAEVSWGKEEHVARYLCRFLVLLLLS